MTGAIVVGDGVGGGSGVTVGTLDRAAADSESGEVARPAAVDSDGASALGWAIGGAGGFVVGAGSVLLLRRRRAAAE